MKRMSTQLFTLLIVALFLATANGLLVASEGGNGGLGLKANLDLPFDAGSDSEDDEEQSPAIIVFYGSSYEADAVVFCLDESGSMNKNNRWELQKREVSKAISELSSASEMGLVYYSGEATSFRPALVKGTESNKSAALGFMNQRTAGGNSSGGTCIAKGVIKSLRLLQRAKSKYRAVIVAGDGRPSKKCHGDASKEARYRQIYQETSAANPGGQSKVHTIFVGTDSDKDAIEFFRQLAQVHNGTFRSVTG